MDRDASADRIADRAVMAALAAAALMFATTTTITSGLPAIALELDASQSQVTFVQDIYTVVLGALVLPAGALLDRYGRRLGMMIGLVILTLCQLWSGLAGSAEELIVSRALAGVGAALVLPGTLATITAVRPGQDYGRGVALWAAFTMLGAGLGLLVAGACVEIADWRLSCMVTAAACAAGLVAVVRMIPETYDPEDAHVDPIGAVLSGVGLLGVTVGIIEWPVKGLDDPVVFLTLGGGLGFLAAFVRWELGNPRPLLDVRLFANPAFAMAALAIMLVFVAGYGWFFLTFPYFAYVMDFGPFLAGVALIPFLVTLVPGALLGPQLAARFGRRRIVSMSLVLMASGVGIMSAVGAADMYAPIGLGFFVFGVGIGIGQAAPTEAIMESLPPGQQGVASAVNDCAREVGATIGVAMMGALFNYGYRSEVSDALSSTSAAVTDAVRVGPAAGTQLSSSGSYLNVPIADTVHDSVIAGWQIAFAVGVVVFLGFALVIGFYARGRAGTFDTPRGEPMAPPPVPAPPVVTLDRPGPARAMLPPPPAPTPERALAPERSPAPVPAIRSGLASREVPADWVFARAARLAHQTNGELALVQYADGPQRWTVFRGADPIAAFPSFDGDLVAALRYHDRARLRMLSLAEVEAAAVP